MAATAPPSSAALLDLLRRSNILPTDRLKALPDFETLPSEPNRAATELVQQGFITKFQATQLLAGRHKGFRLGQYVIQDLLGRGGMGAVYLAQHLELQRKVALKILAPGKGEDQKLALERFLHKARAAAALDHPNIVRIFDVARLQDTPYLVMEFVEGDTLQQWIDRNGPLPHEVAAECIAQAATGLQHAHEKGFVHRDIKPANLIRDPSGAVKILDMGLARSGSDRDKLTEVLDEGAVVGTADYISPEQAINCPSVDSRADIYSLGATFFTLVVGKTPFEGNTTQKLIQHQLRVAPPLRELNPDVPEELAAVVARMLAKKPTDRYQSAAEVIAALAPWAATSARVLAGLSHTSHGTGALPAVSDRALGSSRRLRNPAKSSDSAVDHAQSGKATGVLSSEDTLRDPSVSSPAVTPDPIPAPVESEWRRRAPLLAALGAALLLVVGLGAVLAFNGKGKAPDATVDAKPAPPDPNPPIVQQPAQPAPKTQPKNNPPKGAQPKVEQPKPRAQGDAVYRFDPAAVAPFRVRLNGGTVVDGKRGALPTGVAVFALKSGEAEFTAGPVDGEPALAVRRHTAVGDTHVALEFERDAASQGLGLKLKPDAEYTFRIRYHSDGPAQLAVSIHTLTFRSLVSQTFPSTGGKWASVELPFVRGADPVRVTLAAVGPVGSQAAVGPIEVVELSTEKARLASDFHTLTPFVVRSGLTVDPNDANKKTYQFISQTGAGTPPAGWSARCWNKDTEMEFVADGASGASVMGIRNVRGPGSAMLFSPRFECPSGVVQLRIEYSTVVHDKSFIIRFKPDDQRAAFDVAKPATGGEAWRTENLLVDLKGASGGYFEFHNNDSTPGAAVWFRTVSVVEPSTVSPDRVVFKLDAFDLPGFRNAKTGRSKTSGEDDPKISGIYFAGWKPETQSEWVCGPYSGAKAVGITNLNDVMSAQIGIDLEDPNGVGLKFAPGQIVRVRVTYRTAAKGRGSVYIQNIDDHKVPDRANLPGSNTAWKTVELVTTRGERPLRCLVDTNEKGAGNTLYVRSVVVSEVGAPRPLAAAPTPSSAPAPKTDPALDPATWAEGATLYTLDVSGVPTFRTQKEKGARLGGDTERLPPGTGCQCWKEGAIGEFRCDTIGGVPALGVTNLNDEKSGQYFFSLEGGMKLALQSGKAYRAKVGYRTANDATGTATVHVAPGYKGIGSARLTNTANDWKTATVSFVRPPAEDKVEVRMVIDNTSVGEGNTVWIRSLEIVELIPPKK